MTVQYILMYMLRYIFLDPHQCTSLAVAPPDKERPLSGGGGGGGGALQAIAADVDHYSIHCTCNPR